MKGYKRKNCIDKRKTNNGNTQRKEDGFTQKERLFVQEYLKHFNAARAAREAGYINNGIVQEKGWQILQLTHIQDAIHDAIKQREARLKIEQDEVVKHYMRIAFSDPIVYFNNDGEFVGLENLSPEQRTVIKSVEKRMTKYGTQEKVVFHDKMSALEKLAQHLGMLQTNLNVNDTHTIKLETKVEELKTLGTDKLLELNRLLSERNTN